MNKNTSTKDFNVSSNEMLYLNKKTKYNVKKFANLKPEGLKIYTFKAGFKKKIDDLLIIIFDKTINSAQVYSNTSTPSSPIIWDKKYNKGKVKVLIVNSGNANAHTGKRGIEIIDTYVDSITKLLGCKKNEVLVSSTGVIGEKFNPNLIVKEILKLRHTKPTSILNASKAIMTTDTYPKISIKKIKIEKSAIEIVGIAKGSGMIMPNMGTMLAYIFINTYLTKPQLNKLLRNNLENTFNSISVDSDTSTSDNLFLFSTENKKIKINNKNFKVLNKSLFDLMKDLSLKIIKDGEGLSKLIKVDVEKSKSKKQAKNIGFSIANSPLVKTAIAGADANWGRIIMAIGKSGEKINQNKIKIYFGKNLLCKNGSIYSKINTKKINQYMKNEIIEIRVILQNGKFNHTIYGNDLTYKYIKINADYRS